MKTETILKNARERIANRENWTKCYVYGRRGGGERRDMVDKLSDANCFCAIGACAAELGVPDVKFVRIYDSPRLSLIAPDWLKETKGKDFEKAMKYLCAAASVILRKRGSITSPPEPWRVNDRFGHEATLEMFDLAIKRARRRHAYGG